MDFQGIEGIEVPKLKLLRIHSFPLENQESSMSRESNYTSKNSKNFGSTTDRRTLTATLSLTWVIVIDTSENFDDDTT